MKVLTIVALVLLVGVLFMVIRERSFDSLRSLRMTPIETKVTFPDGYQLMPLVADNAIAAKLGLSEQIEPASMLFIFDSKTIGSIWMKGMHFSIDIIWLDGETVVGFETDVQVEDPPVTIYRSPVPVDHVLEVPAGFVKARNLGVGNQLDIELGEE